MFVFALSANVLPGLLLRASAAFGISFGVLAQVSAVQFIGFFCAAVVGGVLSDIFGKKHLMVAACAVLLAGALTWSVAQGLGLAFVGGALMGIGGGVLESMGSSLLSDLFPDRRKLVLNVSQIAYCGGAVSGLCLMGKLLPLGVNWRVFFVFTGGAAAALLALYAMASLPRPLQDERIHWDALRRIGRRWTFWVPCIVLFCYVLTESMVVVFANAYLRTVHHAPESWAIYSLSLFWTTMGVGRLLCAMIPEHVSYRKIIAGLMLLSAAVLSAQQWQTGWAGSLALFALTGFVFAGSWPLIVGMSAEWNPGYSGTVLGITIAIGALGCVAAPPLMNMLLARLPASVVFPVAALPMVLSAALLVFCRDPKRQ